MKADLPILARIAGLVLLITSEVGAYHVATWLFNTTSGRGAFMAALVACVLVLLAWLKFIQAMFERGVDAGNAGSLNRTSAARPAGIDS